jgi:hypothetical protein
VSHDVDRSELYEARQAVVTALVHWKQSTSQSEVVLESEAGALFVELLHWLGIEMAWRTRGKYADDLPDGRIETGQVIP